MLVLIRELNPSIQIGDDITVTITAINRGVVRVGVKAPKVNKIIRSEIATKDKNTCSVCGSTMHAGLYGTVEVLFCGNCPNRVNNYGEFAGPSD